MASTLISEIDEESPPDWNSPFFNTINDSDCAKDKRKSLHGPPPIYATTFSWKTTEPLIPMVSKLIIRAELQLIFIGLVYSNLIN